MPSFPGRPFGPGGPSIFLARTPRIAFQTIHTSGISSAEAVGPPEIRQVEEKDAVLAEYGWRVLFIDEPDGTVTGHLLDDDSGETLCTAEGSDFQDAWEALGLGTTPPSPELR